MRHISILGSTGSIGTQTLEVVRAYQDSFVIEALSCDHNIDLLEQQILEFRPKRVAVWNEAKAKDLRTRVSHLSVEVLTGMDGLIACATLDVVDIVVGAVVGMIGILPTMEAIKAGKDIALANKETLVCAGHIIMPYAKEQGVSILPVDSEHSAIFQCLNGERREEIDRIILTASGGPFRGRTIEDLEHIKVEDALKHPNWSMGQKITIDSSTMINKGLEVIEAKWLFGVSFDQIEVVIQPQSIIHSMVAFADGAVMAQLGTPDMKLPIQYALFYPNRKHIEGERLDFFKLRELTFQKPDFSVFRGIAIAYEAGRAGGSMPTVFNAANEMAVSKFINREISYLEIPEMIEYAMSKHKLIKNPSIDEILVTEQETYDTINSKWR